MKPVTMYRGGKVIARFPSIGVASEVTNTQRAHIGKVVAGKRKTAGGASWRNARSIKATTNDVAQLDANGNLIAIYSDVATAAEITGIDVSAIMRLLNQQSKKVKGYVFQ